MSQKDYDMVARWYVVHTYSGYENKVKTDLEKTIKNRELEITKFNDKKTNVINNYPNAIKFNVEEAYDILKDLLNELEAKITPFKTDDVLKFSIVTKGNYSDVVFQKEFKINILLKKVNLN